MPGSAASRLRQRQLRQAEEQLANLAGKPEASRQKSCRREANLADAQAARDKIQSDLKRNELLVKTNAVSQQLVDQAARRPALRRIAKVQGLEAALAQMRAPLGREREIKAQQAAVEAAHAAVDMTQWRLDQRHVMAPVGGIVADVLARPGETIPAGGAVVSLLPPENIFVRFFVPETAARRGPYRRMGPARLRQLPRPTSTATISFIAPPAEDTPPVISSESIRAKLVYRVEARPSAGAGRA